MKKFEIKEINSSFFCLTEVRGFDYHDAAENYALDYENTLENGNNIVEITEKATKEAKLINIKFFKSIEIDVKDWNNE